MAAVAARKQHGYTGAGKAATSGCIAARKQHGYTGAGKAATSGCMFWRFTAAVGSIKLLNELRDVAA